MPAVREDAQIRQLERHLSELRGLVGVLSQISRSLDPAEVLASTVQGLRRVLGHGFACFLLFDPTTGRLELVNPADLPPALEAKLRQFVCDYPSVNPHNQEPGRALQNMGDALSGLVLTEPSEYVSLIPLSAQRRPVGVLIFSIGSRRVPYPPSIDVLMSIGEHVGMAVENARLHSAMLKSEEWNRTFIENMPDACWEGDFDGNIIYVNDAACTITGYTRAELLRMHSADLRVRREVPAFNGPDLLEKGYLTNQPAQVRTKSGEIKTISVTTRIVYDSQGRRVSHQSIFRDITEQHRLIEMLQRRNDELAALNAISTILSHPLELSAALDQVCQQITPLVGMEAVAIALVDEPQEKLVVVAQSGMDESLLSEVSTTGLDDPLTRSIVVDGQSLALDDLTKSDAPGLAGPREAGYRAGIAVPVRVRGKPAGAIFAGSRLRVQYEPSDLALLANIGENVGMALENAELYDEMRRRLMELDGLAQLSAACTASLDPHGIADLAVEWTKKLLATDMSSLRLLADNILHLAACRAPVGARLAEQIPLTPAFVSVVTKHEPLIMDDLATPSRLPDDHRERFQALGLGALVLVPMLARDHVIGILMIGQNRSRRWLPREVDLLQTIANQAANAIDNAQLFQNVLSEQRKVQAIFDSGLSGLYATDAEGRIVMFNRAAERITGWTSREVFGKKWEELFADSSSPVPPEPLINQALVGKKTVYLPEGRQIQTRYGTLIPVAKAVAPLVDENDQVTGAVGAFWDLSREREAEMDRARFLSEVAHQLRNPLTALISGLDLLDNRHLSARRRSEMRSMLKSQAERLKNFSRQFLDMQKTMHSIQPVNCTHLDVVEVVQRLVREFQLEHPDYCVETSASESNLIARADRDRVDNILRNLLDNAVSYSPEASTIAVRVHPTEDDRIAISIQDHGVGIPLAEQHHIFEAFYRANQAEGRRMYGHGLGLYIAQQMAWQMDAHIEFSSFEKEGSTFHLILRRTE